MLADHLPFVIITIVLSIAAIAANILVIAVITAAEKLTRVSVCLLFLCIPHLELALLALIHRSIEYHQDPLIKAIDNSATQTNVTNGTGTITCTENMVVESFEHGAILWSILAITSITLNQYVYVESPFWYERHVTTQRLLLANGLAGLLSHLVGFAPMMAGAVQRQECHYNDLALGDNFCFIFSIIVFIIFFAIVALCVRMLVLAEYHRRKMTEHNNHIQTSRTDSMRFLIILIVTYLVSNIIPAICRIVSIYNENVSIAHVKVNILHLVAPIVYATLYGSRTPDGFVRSIRLAICCCWSVKPREKEVEITDIVRVAVVRLGHVMVKIDEQSAHKRHSSFLKTKSRIFSTMSFRKSTLTEHKPLRPYNSMIPTWHRQTSTEVAEISARRTRGRTGSLDLTAIENFKKHPKLGRMASWLPNSETTKVIFDLAAEEKLSQAPPVQIASTKPSSKRPSKPLVDRKLSLIIENSESFETQEPLSYTPEEDSEADTSESSSADEFTDDEEAVSWPMLKEAVRQMHTAHQSSPNLSNQGEDESDKALLTDQHQPEHLADSNQSERDFILNISQFEHLMGSSQLDPEDQSTQVDKHQSNQGLPAYTNWHECPTSNLLEHQTDQAQLEPGPITNTYQSECLKTSNQIAQSQTVHEEHSEHHSKLCRAKHSI